MTAMPVSTMTVLGIALGLTVVQGVRFVSGRRWPFGSYVGLTWAFFVAFATAGIWCFRAGNWVIAVISFLALREYFSMVEIRLQDRPAILAAYASIPFMFHFVTLGWYGMFIISIPVYSFLAIPFLVTLGGREKEGTVFSIGVIDFGLFLFVYCMGHISYLMSYSVWMAAMLILDVAVCDGTGCLLRDQARPAWAKFALECLLPVPATVLLSVVLSPWTAIPVRHSAVLGAMIPLLALMGRRTGSYVEADLGVAEEGIGPGRGQILDNLKSLLLAAPIVFHYIRYFLDLP
jgi:phosphatidate cytidylyltransferase